MNFQDAAGAYCIFRVKGSEVMKTPIEGFRRERAAALIISLFMICAFLISFVLQSLLARIFGASSDLDAFTVGTSLVYLFINGIAYAVVSIILVPVFTEYRLAQDAQATAAANTFITFLLLLSIAVSILCVMAAPQIIAVLGRGFDTQTRALAVNLVRMLMPVIPIGVICGTLSGLLRAYEKYYITPIARCFELMTVVGALLVLGKFFGIYSIPIGMIMGALLSLAIHLYYSLGTGMRFRFNLAVRQEKVRALLTTFFLFGLIITSVHLVFLVDRLVASFLSPGSVALYHFASRFQILIVMILPVAVSIPFYTKLNQHLQDRNQDEVRSTIHHGLRLVAVAIVPLITMLVVLRIPVIELWLLHGAFTSEDTQTVASVFLYLAPSFLFDAIAPIALHIFFSLRDTKALKLLVLVVLAEVGSNIVLDFILVRPLGLNGIALATSIVKFPTALISWIYISRYLGGLRLRSLSPYLLKVAVASLCMAPVVLCADNYLSGALGFATLGKGLRLVILFCLGGSAYIILCVPLKVREVTEIGRTLYKKLL